MDNNNQDIMLSVCMVTYNHEKFIEQAINGILSQKFCFKLEIVIGEDCSTDNTRQLCIQYKEKYPDIIKLNLPQTNQGAQPNFIDTYKLCTGKYIALCEGDDYWTDENKLQKQVDFLEQNPDFSLSSHNSAILAHNGNLLYDPPLDKTVYTTENLIDLDWGIMTASIVFRRSEFYFPDWFKDVRNGDYALQLLLSTKGNINYFPEYMSVYRRHLGGITSQFNPFSSTKTLHLLLNAFNEETGYKYNSNIKRKLCRIYKGYATTAKNNKLRRQQIALQLIYCFSKLGIDILPTISNLSVFKKK